ncbi:nucleoside deaminase [bacterium]|nr:nucleoside deaminase [bacterium]
MNIFDEDHKYMDEALKEARKAFEEGEVPVGAVILDRKGNILGRGHNRVIGTSDPSAHAEIIAIRKACSNLKYSKLYGTILYVTLEPCPMCMQAIALANISKIIYGARDPSMGAVESAWNMVNSKMFKYPVQYRGGVKEGECALLLKDFFKDIRREKKYEKEISCT